MFANLFVFGEPAALQLGVDELAVDAHFEPSAVGRDEDKTLNPGFEFRDELFGQADRLRFIVSRLAVDEFDFHHKSFLILKGSAFKARSSSNTTRGGHGPWHLVLVREGLGS